MGFANALAWVTPPFLGHHIKILNAFDTKDLIFLKVHPRRDCQPNLEVHAFK
jgi:hypothetical protein